MACSPAKRQAMEICPNLHPRKIWVNIRTQRPSTLIFVRILSQFTTNANAGPRTPASNLQVKSVALKVRHHFQCSASFHDNRTFFRRKEVAQIFISHIESPAPEATPSVWLLP